MNLSFFSSYLVNIRFNPVFLEEVSYVLLKVLEFGSSCHDPSANIAKIIPLVHLTTFVDLSLHRKRHAEKNVILLLLLTI